MATWHTELGVAFELADLADEVTLRWWSRTGVRSTAKADGSPVTGADVEAEEAIFRAVRDLYPADGFVGEEVGETVGTTGRRWIVDGIDGTRFFAAGESAWGTLIALEERGEIVLGLASSPAQDRRWWATGGGETFAGSPRSASQVTRLRVSQSHEVRADRLATLPGHDALAPAARQAIEGLTGDRPAEHPWSHQLRVAEGELDACIWFAGGVWDHAAPSLIVEEAGGRFSDHRGTRCLDTRTGIYTNGVLHDRVLAVLDEREPTA